MTQSQRRYKTGSTTPPLRTWRFHDDPAGLLLRGWSIQLSLDSPLSCVTIGNKKIGPRDERQHKLPALFAERGRPGEAAIRLVNKRVSAHPLDLNLLFVVYQTSAGLHQKAPFAGSRTKNPQAKRSELPRAHYSYRTLQSKFL